MSLTLLATILAETAEFPPTELAAALAIVAAVGGGAVYILDSIYLRKKNFHTIRDRDRAEVKAQLDDHLAESKIWRSGMEAKANDLSTRHELLVAGPIREFTSALDNIRRTLENFDARSEHRNEKVLEALTKFDTRVTVVETRQKGVLEVLASKGHHLGLGVTLNDEH